MQIRRFIARLLGRAPIQPRRRVVTRYVFGDEIDRYGPAEVSWRTPPVEPKVTDVDILARTHVERSEHFIVPRFGA